MVFFLIIQQLMYFLMLKELGFSGLIHAARFGQGFVPQDPAEQELLKVNYHSCW